MDVIADLAFPLPISVISEMLGLPAEDHDRIRGWSNALLPSFSPAMSLAAVENVNCAVEEFSEYIRFMIALRKAEPRDDLLSALLAAYEGGEKLT